MKIDLALFIAVIISGAFCGLVYSAIVYYLNSKLDEIRRKIEAAKREQTNLNELRKRKGWK